MEGFQKIQANLLCPLLTRIIYLLWLCLFLLCALICFAERHIISLTMALPTIEHAQSFEKDHLKARSDQPTAHDAPQ